MTDEARRELSPDEWASELSKRLGTTDIAAIRMFWQIAYDRGKRDALSEKFELTVWRGPRELS